MDGLHKPREALVTRAELDAVEEKAMKALKEGLVVVDQQVSSRIPQFWIDDEILEKLRKLWRNSVIIKLLGKSISFFQLRARLTRDWRTEYEYEIIDVGMGYYVIKFKSNSDCMSVLTGGPYKIFDHYLAVQPWEPNFQPAQAKLPKTAIWVHFTGVPMEYYQEHVLLKLGDKVGKAIKVDMNALIGTRGQFARVCVEFDLTHPLPTSVEFKFFGYAHSTWIKCVYEGLHTICFTCGQFGHKSEICTLNHQKSTLTETNASTQLAAPAAPPPPPPSATENWLRESTELGPWMIAQSGKKKTNQSTTTNLENHRDIRKESDSINSGMAENKNKTKFNPPTGKKLNTRKKPGITIGNQFSVLIEENTEDAKMEESIISTEIEMADANGSAQENLPIPSPQILEVNRQHSNGNVQKSNQVHLGTPRLKNQTNKSQGNEPTSNSVPTKSKQMDNKEKTEQAPLISPQAHQQNQAHVLTLPAPTQGTPNHYQQQNNLPPAGPNHASSSNPIDPGDKPQKPVLTPHENFQIKKDRMRQQLESFVSQQLRDGNTESLRKLRQKLSSLGVNLEA